MTDYANLNITSLDDLVTALTSEVGTISRDWLDANAGMVEGYFRSLGEAALQTRAALAEARISPEAADMIMHGQELAFHQTLRFSKFITFALAQQLLDGVFRVIGWAIFNQTKVNLFPGLVTPTQ